MIRPIVLSFVLLLFLVAGYRHNVMGQGYAATDTIRLGGVIENGDTVAMIFLDEVEKIGIMPRRLARQKNEWNRLKANVYKVYPYAVMAAEVLKDVDVNLAKLEGKKERKAYLKTVERELNKRFKGELENLSIGQGQILVKLINRQTGKNCFSIIRELKGGFSAVVWQSVALLFSNNLKREYDPYDRDKEIESIVRELETNNYYKYQYQVQSRR